MKRSYYIRPCGNHVFRGIRFENRDTNRPTCCRMTIIDYDNLNCLVLQRSIYSKRIKLTQSKSYF